jgi:hypothetical protein
MGIDVGATSGAWALLDGSTALCGDLPVADGNVAPAHLYLAIREMAPSLAIVEKVNAFPGQGVRSVWSFAQAYGSVLACLACAGVPVQLVSPVVWKKHYNLPGKDKEKARALAIRLFPTLDGLSRKKDHNRGEAVLLAEYGRMKF